LTEDGHMATETSSFRTRETPTSRPFSRIAVGINGLPEGEDALALGATLALASGGELTLVAVHPDLLVLLPSEMDWGSMKAAARATLRDARDRMVPQARMLVERDVSVPRALRRVIERTHRDLLVLGSSRHAEDGHVRVGKRTRQLLGQFDCALAIAPKGLAKPGEPTLSRIGVGYDGGVESQAALQRAAALAAGSGATLDVLAVVDDRLPRIGWTSLSRGSVSDYGEQTIHEELDRLCQDLETAARGVDVPIETEVHRGRPADSLLELSGNVDLLLIGSRRWGPMARVILGSTGEALLHDAACPVVAVPRPPG
jgi:nucleotide-binding universal stress UspA family protein